MGQIALPGALLFIVGAALVYWALHSFDAKNGTFGHRIAKGAA